MEVLAIDGKNYVKSSVIARELGYTSDYVGQLCRSGKVDAKLFGRTWYVEKSSIAGHKVTRYRSSKALTKRVLKTHTDTDEPTPVAVHRENHFSREQSSHENHFYTHAKKNDRVAARYSYDDTTLLPELLKGKPPYLQISHADAQKLKVTAPKDAYNFEVPTLPQIRFKGRLTVQNIEDELHDQSVTDASSAQQEKMYAPMGKGVTIHPKEVESFKTKKAINKVISDTSSKNKKEFHLEVHAQNLASFVPVQVQDLQQSACIWVYVRRMLSGAFLGLLLSILLFTVSSNIEFYNSSLTSKYTFEFETLSEFFKTVL